MNIKNRECFVVELSNGDKCYFLEKVKGKELRKIFEMQASIGTSDATAAGLALVTKLPELFCTFCVVINDNKEPSVEYLDELEAVDFIAVQEAISKSVELATSGLKASTKKK